MTAEQAIFTSVARHRGAVASTLVTLTAVLGFACTVIWAGTGFGYYWPAWIWFSGLVVISLFWLIPQATEGREGPRLRFALHVALTVWVVGILFALWLLGGGGAYWPFVTTVLLAAAVALHELTLRRIEQRDDSQLEERVVELTRTRRGALDVQAQELRRIERDLHDGAQARLVALSMKLGRAEERLADRPEDRELVREAREEAGAAIAELRDLARGIAPPVLADRGLPAAVEALGSRSAIPVEVRAPDTDEGSRPAPVIEAVAYFVAAESLTNAAKHAGGPAVVEISRSNGHLLVTVSDEGPGGADPAGNGLSGLRGRVEAVDGSLHIDSPPGEGTTITAELPCE